MRLQKAKRVAEDEAEYPYTAFFLLVLSSSRLPLLASPYVSLFVVSLTTVSSLADLVLDILLRLSSFLGSLVSILTNLVLGSFLCLGGLLRSLSTLTRLALSSLPCFRSLLGSLIGCLAGLALSSFACVISLLKSLSSCLFGIVHGRFACISSFVGGFMGSSFLRFGLNVTSTREPRRPQKRGGPLRRLPLS